MAEHLRHRSGHNPALALVEMRQRYLEESREPLPGDLHMLTLLRAYYSAVDPNGTLLLEPEHIFTNDEYAVGLIRYKARRGDDKAMDMRNVHVWRVRDGKVAEYWFHPSDLHVVESFWN
jgi:hypothetical protein